MKVTTEGLTLGIIRGLERSGYIVSIDGDGHYADIAKEAPYKPSEELPQTHGWGSMGEYL